MIGGVCKRSNAFSLSVLMIEGFFIWCGELGTLFEDYILFELFGKINK